MSGLSKKPSNKEPTNPEQEKHPQKYEHHNQEQQSTEEEEEEEEEKAKVAAASAPPSCAKTPTKNLQQTDPALLNKQGPHESNKGQRGSVVKESSTPRNQPLEPYLERLPNDVNAQRGLFTGIFAYQESNGVSPFANRSTLRDFITNGLEVDVSQLDLLRLIRNLIPRCKATGNDFGQDLKSLSPLVKHALLSAIDDARLSELVSVPIKPSKNAKSQQEEEKKNTGQDDESADGTRLIDLFSTRKKPSKKGNSQQMEKNEEKVHGGNQDDDSKRKEKEKKENPRENSTKCTMTVATVIEILKGILHYHSNTGIKPLCYEVTLKDMIKYLGFDIPVSKCRELIKKLRENYEKKKAGELEDDENSVFWLFSSEKMFDVADRIWGTKTGSFPGGGGGEKGIAEVAEHHLPQVEAETEGGKSIASDSMVAHTQRPLVINPDEQPSVDSDIRDDSQQKKKEMEERKEKEGEKGKEKEAFHGELVRTS